MIAIGGNFVLTGGTSASAPIFASVVAAINDARLAFGKKPVGWLNPAVCLHIRPGSSDLIVIIFSSTALLSADSACIQRRHEWHEPGLWDRGIPSGAWLGSHYWLGHSQLPEALGSFLASAVRYGWDGFCLSSCTRFSSESRL